MSENKKKRKYTRRHLNWRLDYDYWHKLSDAEKEWLDKFNDEYYRNTFDELNSVHDLDAPVDYEIRYSKKRNGTVKQQLMYEEYVRRRDILYNYSTLLNNNSSSYTPEMYSESVVRPSEDDIIDLVDVKNKTKDSKKLTDKKYK